MISSCLDKECPVATGGTVEIGCGIGGGATSFSNSLSTDFDGSNDRIVVPYNASMDFQVSGEFTGSFYMKTSTASNSGIIGSWEFTPSAQRQWLMFVTASGQLQFFISTNGTAQASWTTSETFDDGAWHHIIFTYKSGEVPQIYDDGTSLSLGGVSAGSMTSFSNPVVMGSVGDTGATQHYPGRLDEITLWDVKFNGSQVTELYNSGTPIDPTGHSISSNLVAWWRMGDGDTHPTVTDNSSNTNNGTMTNMDSGDFVSDTP